MMRLFRKRCTNVAPSFYRDPRSRRWWRDGVVVEDGEDFTRAVTGDEYDSDCHYCYMAVPHSELVHDGGEL
jgi:hypothetical protein